MKVGVERKETQFFLGSVEVPGDAGERVDFVVHRMCTVCNDVKLVTAVIDMDSVSAFRKEVDCGCAVKQKVCAIDHTFEDRVTLPEQ
ncbi:hypothetical protein SDC9_184461 [bioreactor metagenome]|uniref:Uncharacterized protein n=1 Tax=bioreactor metagenome TaxID=1076179 RepID=A0A645HFK7_9ZZZZ